MNLLLVDTGDFTDEYHVSLRGRRHQHLTRILKVCPGHTLPVGQLNGDIGIATVIESSKQHVRLQLQLHHPPPPAANASMVLSLPRPLMFKRILQCVTTLGIKDIHFIHSEKVEKSYWNSSDLAGEVIHEQLLLGLEQSMDTALPSVHFHRHFRTFVRDTLPLIANAKRTLLAHPGPYAPCPANLAEPFVLAIGPEGGFTDAEVEAFSSQNFTPIQLGPRILRVENAVSVLLGRLLPFSL